MRLALAIHISSKHGKETYKRVNAKNPQFSTLKRVVFVCYINIWNHYTLADQGLYECATWQYGTKLNTLCSQYETTTGNWYLASKHETLAQRCFTVGPPSTTLAQQ